MLLTQGLYLNPLMWQIMSIMSIVVLFLYLHTLERRSLLISFLVGCAIGFHFAAIFLLQVEPEKFAILYYYVPMDYLIMIPFILSMVISIIVVFGAKNTVHWLIGITLFVVGIGGLFLLEYNVVI